MKKDLSIDTYRGFRTRWTAYAKDGDSAVAYYAICLPDRGAVPERAAQFQNKPEPL